jgi:hypothetical protein
LRYLSKLYEAFDGDFAMAIILGEISHHKTSRHFSPDEIDNSGARAITSGETNWDEMQGYNAYSISSRPESPASRCDGKSPP